MGYTMELRAIGVHRLAVMLVSCLAVSSVEANYTLEILIESYQNPTHQALELAIFRHGCCDLDPVLPCKACDNAFRVCIREESTGIAQGGCSIAELTTSLIAVEDDNLMFSLGDDIGGLSNPLIVSGDEWPGSVEIMFTVYDLDGTTTIEPSSDVVDNIIVHPTISAVPSLSDPFTDTMDYNGTYSSLQLAFRLTCGPDHYGPNCTFCRETNDSSGHFSCDKTVGKVCLEGYQNPQTNCVECSPPAGCSAEGGFCTQPGACLCREGYTGVNCASISPVLDNPVCAARGSVPGSSYVLVPVSPSDSGHMLMIASADEARNTAVCHAVCINYVFEGESNFTNSTNSTIPSPGSEMEGVFQLNCKQFKQYLDCRTGCITQSENQACPEICSGRCQGICGSNFGCFGVQVENNDCGVACTESDCSQGCQRFSQLPSSVFPKPVNAPVLTRVVDNQHIYDVDIPIEIELQVYDNPSLLFRIEDQSQPGEYVYQWMVDMMFDLPEITMMEYLLNLNTFIGRRVNISYAFATDNGLSEYSASTIVQVPDQCVVVPLTQSELDISASLDERAGFFTHYVLNVSWCPTTCTEQLSHYVVTRKLGGGDCGEEVSITAVATSSSILLQSNTSQPIFLPCTQTVQVQTVLVDGTTQEVSESIRLKTVSSVIGFPELEIVGCPARYDRQSEVYTVDFQWEAPFSPAALSHIRVFAIRADVLLRLVANEFAVARVGVFFADVPVNPNFDETHYNIITQLPPLERKDFFYQIAIQVIWMAPEGPERSDNCRPVDVFAPPPLPVQVINITSIDTVNVARVGEDSQDVTVSASVQWEIPQLQFSGDIIRYEIHLGRRALQPNEEGENTDTDTNDDSLQTESVQRTFRILLDQLTLRTFLQIRSLQFDDFPSNWSEAKEINFVVIRRPDAVDNLEVDFTEVETLCNNTDILLELDGRVVWTAFFIAGGDPRTFEYYKLSIGDGPVLFLSDREYADFAMIQIPFSRGASFVELEFQISVAVSLLGVIRESFPRSVVQRFQSIPFPQDIKVTATNPRILQLQSSGMQEISLELFVSWIHPQFEVSIRNFEIYISYSEDDYLCAYDLSSQSARIMSVPGDTTEVRFSLTDRVAKWDKQILVQVRSRVEDITFLPQWSPPIALNISALPPPTIVSSELIQTNVKPDDVSGGFTVNATVRVSLELPEGSEELDFFEVWIGDRNLMEYDEPESGVSGVVFQFQASAATSTRLLSAVFSSIHDHLTIYIQTRSVGVNGIPEWSAPITHEPTVTTVCPTATVTSTATFFIFRTETGPDLTVPECIVPTTVTAPTSTPAPEVTVRLTGAKRITVILRDVNQRWTQKVQGSSASALFTDVVSGPIWIRAVGRGADGMKHHTEWLSFTVE